ncbi:hypothetical protein DMB92_04945 [Campylobacter sp. MIT 99-7217]|uniref:DUF308 domain-containing protein n=1 Tax=Campylobacter sp. MIT 99-7217 TaxID=535091 RepID=UPI00115BF6DE|nr:DUF308 domain-containing protein [Campylobacter sp. MIT 99-7217]TQR32447.1 hypothetical protein DMB92_04945 [Campylobacter sp. MIT 99-7217]
MKTFASVLWIIFSVLLIVTALIGLFTPFEVFVSFVFFLPFLLIAGGISNIAYYFSFKELNGANLLLMDGILNLIFAFIFIALGIDFASLVTIYVFAFMVAFKGILGISYALELKKTGISSWIYSFIWAILSILIAIIFIAMPSLAGITIGIMISLLVFFFALASLLTFFGVKKVFS